MHHIAYLSMDDLTGFVTYEELTHAPLAARGIAVQSVSWRARHVDWSHFDLVVIRTPWDYQQDAAAFLQVLGGIDAATRLENSLSLCRWNLSKTYLRQLSGAGVPIVDTVWGSGTPPQAQLFEKLGVEEIVIKPLVSANADHTYRLDLGAFAAQHDILRDVFATRPWMAQPFMRGIVDEGEHSLFYFDGVYSHAILKTPEPGDFRVQEEHGGFIQAVQPEASLVAVADRCMANLPEPSLYARVDLVRAADTWRVMEVELIEPSLYFPYDRSAPERFAEAIHRRIVSDI
jgi:glutathione synthase/RimK-type ligase-like ATP-grasp enzyme